MTFWVARLAGNVALPYNANMSNQKITKETAEHYLRDVDPMWRAFWFHMHFYAKNLAEFCQGLREIDEGVYLYHAEGHKNDLSKWVREVVGDGALADQLDKVKTRKEAVEITCNRVEELKSLAASS